MYVVYRHRHDYSCLVKIQLKNKIKPTYDVTYNYIYNYT